MSHADSNQCPQCGGKLIAPEQLALNERNLWCEACSISHSTPLSSGEEAWVLARTDTPDLVQAWSWETSPAETKPEIVWTRKIAEVAKLSHARVAIVHRALWNAGLPIDMIREAELIGR